MPDTAWREYRDLNPYSTPRNPHVPNPFFYTSDQERVYNDIYLNQKTKVTKQHSLDIDHLKLDRQPTGEPRVLRQLDRRCARQPDRRLARVSEEKEAPVGPAPQSPVEPATACVRRRHRLLPSEGRVRAPEGASLGGAE